MYYDYQTPCIQQRYQTLGWIDSVIPFIENRISLVERKTKRVSFTSFRTVAAYGDRL